MSAAGTLIGLLPRTKSVWPSHVSFPASSRCSGNAIGTCIETTDQSLRTSGRGSKSRESILRRSAHCTRTRPLNVRLRLSKPTRNEPRRPRPQERRRAQRPCKLCHRRPLYLQGLLPRVALLPPLPAPRLRPSRKERSLLLQAPHLRPSRQERVPPPLALRRRPSRADQPRGLLLPCLHQRINLARRCHPTLRRWLSLRKRARLLMGLKAREPLGPPRLQPT